MQAVLPALQKSPAQDKADLSKPGNPKHGAHRQVVAGPKSGSTPLQDLSNGSKPARISSPSPLTDCPKSSHSADKKGVSGGTAAMRLAGSKLDQPAAKLQSSDSKESKSLTSHAVAKSNSHSSSRTGMQAFSKGMSPHGLVTGRAACKVSHHPNSRRAADASSRSVSSTGAVSALSTSQTQPSQFAFSPFRNVKGQQAEGQQEQSKAATATTWSNPMFACSTAPPSFCGSAIASRLVPVVHAKPEGHRRTGPLPFEPARQPSGTEAAEPNKSSPALDDLIRQMQMLSIAGSCSSSSSEQESVLPAVADPADAPQRSADAAQASSAPAQSLSSSDLNMDSQSTPDVSSPMMASPTAASEASDASLAELYAMLDAGLLDSPSPAAGSFGSADPAVHRRDVSPVPFGPLSSTTDADEDALQASAAAALVSFRQAAVHTEGVPNFHNAHGVLADQLWGDHPAKSHTPEVGMGCNMPYKEHHLSLTCLTFVLVYLQEQDAFDNKTHPCSVQKHQFVPGEANTFSHVQLV